MGFPKEFPQSQPAMTCACVSDLSSGPRTGHPVGYFLSPLATILPSRR